MNSAEHDKLLGGLDERTKAIKDTLDERTDTILTVLTEVHIELKKQNGRIGALERWQARILGGIGLAAFIATTIALKGSDILKVFE